MKKVKVEIDAKVVLKFLAIVSGVLLIIYLKAVLLIFLVSFITMAALLPVVRWLEAKKVPKSLAVAIVIFVIIAFVLGTAALVSIPLIKQLRLLVDKFPEMLEDFIDLVNQQIPWLSDHLTAENINQLLSDYQIAFASQIENLWGNVGATLKATFGLVGSLLTAVTTFTLSVYMLIEHDRILKSTLMIADAKKRKQIRRLIEEVEVKVGAWLRGQVVLCVAVGLLTWVCLSILGVKYAGALGVLAGLLEVIPILGPILTAIPVSIAGFSAGVWQGVGSMIVVLLIQQIENALLVPFIMKKAVGLNPVLTLLALLIGSELFGPIGAVIAIPAASIGTVLVEEYLASNGIIIRKGQKKTNSAPKS